MFTYTPYLRVTPLAGTATVYQLSTLTFMTVARQIWEPLFLQKETVNRRLINIPLGWRERTLFTFTVESASSAETSLVAIGLAINHPDATVELSMNGGTLYRTVVLSSWSRMPPEDKNIAAVYEVEFATVEPISADSVPPEVLTGPPAIAGWS